MLRVLCLAREFDDFVALGEAGLHVSDVDVDVGNDVLRCVVDAGRILFRVDDRSAVCECLVDRKHRRQLLVLDANRLQRLLGDRLGVRGHRRDAVSHKPHAVFEHPRIVGRGLGVALPRSRVPCGRRVLVRQHARDPGHRLRFGCVDRHDLRMRVWASENLDVQHSRKQKVGDEHRLPGHERATVDLPLALPDDREVLSRVLSHLRRPLPRPSSIAPPNARRRSVSRSPCSGTGYRRAPRESPAPWGRESATGDRPC